MDKVLMITLLYDFYGDLLTDKQKSALELHYLDDLSLQEIGVRFGITRQAVADIIKRSEKILMQYEAKLLLVERYLKQKKELDIVLKKLDGIIASDKSSEYSEIRKTLVEIID